MATPAENGLEQQLREVNTRINVLEREAADDHEKAQALVEEMAAKGVKFVDLDSESEDFQQVDAAFKVGDDKRHQASQDRVKANRLMEMLGRSTPAQEQAQEGFKTAAEAFMSSPEYERAKATGAFQSEQAKFDLTAYDVVNRDTLAQRIGSGTPLFATVADGAALVPIDQRLYPPVAIPVRQLRVLDMITVGTTDSDQINYTAETTRTDAAAETAYGTAYGEAAYVYSLKTANVRDIGHWTPAHRSQLADAGQLQTLIEGRLEYGVERRLEDEIVNGDGTGVNMTGILNTSGIGVQQLSGTSTIDTIHKGITKVRTQLFAEPDAIGIHPTSYETIVLEKASTAGMYQMGPPNQAESPTIWGKPFIVSTAFPTNLTLVGAFKTGAVCWVRSGVSIRATDSHSDYFTKRMVAILAEMRAAFAAWQPLAFCSVDIED